MNKAIKYSILVVIIGIILYNSVYIQRLDMVRKGKNDLEFNAKAYASNFMSGKIETLPAINATDFLENISNDHKDYCEQKGRKLGISDEYNFIIEGKATVASIEEEFISVVLGDGKELRIATDFIFGNAIRDGSAMADIGDFQNMMDFNSISVELNNIVRETIVLPFKENANPGAELYFKGAVKINVEKPQIIGLKVIPMIIEFNN